MNKKEIICYIIVLVFVGIWFIWIVIEPETNYYDLPLEYRIRMEQRMITW